MNKKDRDILIAMNWQDEQDELERQKKLSKTVLRCKNCGKHISQYGPETFHIDSTMIRCANGESKAEVEDIDE